MKKNTLIAFVLSGLMMIVYPVYAQDAMPKEEPVVGDSTVREKVVSTAPVAKKKFKKKKFGKKKGKIKGKIKAHHPHKKLKKFKKKHKKNLSSSAVN